MRPIHWFLLALLANGMASVCGLLWLIYGRRKIMYTTAIIAIGNVAVLCFFAWLFYRDLE